MQKIRKILKFLFLIWVVIGIYFLLQLPTIADWGDYESYDSSSSYDDWGSSSSDSWSSSSSDWGSSSWDDDWDDYGSSSSHRGGYSMPFIISNHPGLLIFIIIAFIILFIFLMYKGYKDTHYSSGNIPKRFDIDFEIMKKRAQNRDALFGVSDKEIEDAVQAEDPLFNKAEFLHWAEDVFIRLQYAWSNRNLEEVRTFITPELYEQTNSQIQRYIQDKHINKLERISVNLSRLYSYDKQGDRDILRVVLESKMTDYIIEEVTNYVIKGNRNTDIINPYILTFVRKSGVKTEDGGIKPVTMNCPNCGGATTILSSGKCPYCGSIITTRDNKWTLLSLKRYNPNA